MNLFYAIIRAIVYLPFKLFYPTKVINKKDFPKEKKIILVCNHLSWKDILVTAINLPGYRHFVAKKEIGKNRLVHRLAKWLGVIFIDRGKADMTAMREILGVLKKGEGMTIFPEGTRNKVDTSLQEVKSGVVMFSVKGDAPIVPAMIHSKARAFHKNYVCVLPKFELETIKGRRLDTPTVEEGADIVAEKLAEAKALLDYFVSHKKDKEYRRLMKDGKRARKNALKAARSLICK